MYVCIFPDNKQNQNTSKVKKNQIYGTFDEMKLPYSESWSETSFDRIVLSSLDLDHAYTHTGHIQNKLQVAFTQQQG